LSPDVLILDEVLAVGDIGFVIKCLNRVRQLTANAAVVFVSHQMQFVSSFCSRVLFMDHGLVELDASEPKDAVDRYFELAKHDKQLAGVGTVQLHDVSIQGVDQEGRTSHELLAQGCNATIYLDFTVLERKETARLNLSIDDESSAQVITSPLVGSDGQYLDYGPGRHRLRISLGALELNSGKYSLMISSFGSRTKNILVRIQGQSPFRITSSRNFWSKIVRPVVPERVL
jgi:lipopolysaccharide transport system ATP-binding protein